MNQIVKKIDNIEISESHTYVTITIDSVGVREGRRMIRIAKNTTGWFEYTGQDGKIHTVWSDGAIDGHFFGSNKEFTPIKKSIRIKNFLSYLEKKYKLNKLEEEYEAWILAEALTR